MDQAKIFAHRGSKGTHPENTMAAFREAVRLGADGIELDVHLTRDKQVVVIHDEKVDRTTNGTGFVKDHSLQELKQLDAGSWFHPSYEQETIPTLEEVFTLIRETPLQVNIELKTDHIQYEGIEDQVIQLVRQHQLEDRVILSSFNHYSLVKTKQLAPEMETGILFMEGLFEPWEYAKRLGASALHCYYPIAFSPIGIEALQQGMAVRPFTVNHEEHMKQLFQQKISAIITDYPGKALEIKRSYNK
ncbi:glycerophosphodiester phosphodiesterase [Rubeoparvulum massiliense]|uniref:glycerophosphodiester phosphodiesterase n=1 Tax=Rubeoparvulum massiliense TaxID=1631346 RepID=UPI00065E6D61|nr:glycerophosphodiester phosphodiesterase [Rubeoparvulum massiliense]